MNKRKISLILLGFTLFMGATGCRKKVAPPPPPPPPKEEPPPPPPPAKPSIAQFVAEPSTIQRGQSATLRWSVSDATDISINQGIGAVQAQGTRQVFPNDTTTYTLTAKGPGGTDSRSATVSVTVPPPPPPPPPPPKPARKTLSEMLSTEVQDAYFDYDKSDIREDARAALTRNATALKTLLSDYPSGAIVIEGHCDERGSAEYNLGLGDRRATSARDFLVQLGVPADRLKTISYGKERPQCTESNEDCWQRNRRVHFSSGE
jgi:peptidoglycan-associated lipoprotein